VAFARFAAAVAARYAPYGLWTWEIWNEENNTEFWKPAVDPMAYTSLLKQTYVAIKAVEPRTTVLTGGTSACGTGDGNLSASKFLSAIYADGGGGYFDGVSDHPYTQTYLPSVEWNANPWRQMVLRLRTVMVDHGDADKQVWITEFGAPTAGPGSAAVNGRKRSDLADGHVTTALQAQILSVAVRLARAHAWIGCFVWYSYQDAGTSRSNSENFYGLINANGTPKPALREYKAAIAR
jgi:hypothetical protein